jgi:hypothetical protein
MAATEEHLSVRGAAVSAADPPAIDLPPPPALHAKMNINPVKAKSVFFILRTPQFSFFR